VIERQDPVEDHCGHCGALDTGGSGWAAFDVGMASGARGGRHTSTVRTELRGYLVCAGCLASPWGAALQTILEHPDQVHTVEYRRCTVLCTHLPSRKVRFIGGHLIGRRPVVTCPSCWSPADVEHLADTDGLGRIARWLLRTLPDFRPNYPHPTH
jgi:hypothetical protein